MIVRLAHVCIEATDLESTEAFYQALGAERRFEFRNLQHELIGMYMYFGGDSFIEIVKVATPRPNGRVAHFALQVEDIHQAHQQLRDAGIEVSAVELGGDETLMVTCHDPNDVFIELHQYTERSMQYHGGTCSIDYKP
jgi:glyoxylase I family protein